MKVVLCNCFMGQRGTRVTLKDQVEYTPAVELRTSKIAGLNAFKDKDHHHTRGPLPIPALGPHGDQSKGKALVCCGCVSAGGLQDMHREQKDGICTRERSRNFIERPIEDGAGEA